MTKRRVGGCGDGQNEETVWCHLSAGAEEILTGDQGTGYRMEVMRLANRNVRGRMIS